MCSKARSSIEVEGKSPVTLKAGDVLFVPARTDPFGEETSGAAPGLDSPPYVVEKESADHIGEVTDTVRALRAIVRLW